ncbi:MAG: hypothetical protein ACT4R6_00865 [Gemmatimonadaceae bacterium]
MFRRLMLLAATCGLSGVVACTGGDAPSSGPAGPSAAVAASLLGGPGGYGSQYDPRLLADLERERWRIALASAAGAAQRTLLKPVWDQLQLAASLTGTGQFVACEPLDYAATAKIVGPPGERFAFGPHVLVVPPGALTRWYVVTAEAPVALHAEARFDPHGLTFTRGNPAALTMSYKHCARSPNAATRIVYVDASLDILEWPASWSVEDEALVGAAIGHFSSYLVAY